VQDPVERGTVTAVGDPPEDLEVPFEVEVRTSGPEVEESEPGEPPGLVKVKIEDDLQIATPAARIASR
jgi:hypothetical protein